MLSRFVSFRSFFAWCAVCALAGCGESQVRLAPQPIGTTSVLPTASAGPTVRPSASPSIGPSIAPSSSPSASPSAMSSTPSPSPAPAKTTTPSPSPSAAPSGAAKALWGLVGSTVVEFTSNQIGSGTVAPIHQFSIATASYTYYVALAFDSAGDLWIAEGGDSGGTLSGRVVEFGAAQLSALAATPNPQPVVTLTLAGEAEGLAFDRSGNLWTSTFGSTSGGQIEKYTAAQIALGGSPAPAVTLTPGGDGGALTFGTDGTLWYVPLDIFGPSNGFIYGLAPSQLTASGSPTPAYDLNVPGDSAHSGQDVVSQPPDQVAFDLEGNLWSVFNGEYFEFAAASLHAGSPSPSLTIAAYPAQTEGGDVAVYHGYALAFDSANDLIGDLVTGTTASLEEYSPAQYQGSSPVATSATFGSNVTITAGIFGNFIAAGPYVP